MAHADRFRSRSKFRHLMAERLEDRRLLASLLGANEGHLLPRIELVKPAATVVDSLFHEMERFLVKFQDELPIRLRDGELVELDFHSNQIRRTSNILGSDQFQSVLGLVEPGSWQRMDSVSEDTLDNKRQVAQANLGRQISDLNSYFYVDVPDAENLASIIDAFNGLDIVELASPIPRHAPPPSWPGASGQPAGGSRNSLASPPSPPPPPIPGDFQANQGYLNAAPDGVDALGVWSQYGIRGAGVGVLDIEYTFDDRHQDLPSVIVVGSTPQDPGFGPDHGTAVLGEMAGLDNGWGVTGIAPDSQYYFAGAFTDGAYRLGEALTAATEALLPGDVILIEQQLWGPRSNPGSGSQFGMVPVEWWEPYYSRIVTAVGNGIIVVEAAGNGSQDLDDPIYSTGNNGHHPFLAENDSGAIIVGAGASPAEFGSFQPARSRLGFSNYGSRVDLQGWGHNVWTTGYGDAYSQEGLHLYFTRSFSGTSSASPIVAGAASLVQSAYKEFTGEVLLPSRIRQVLRETGTPQQDGPNPLTQNIGPLPNALAAIEQILLELQFQWTVGPESSHYVEDSPPVPIAAESIVLNADFSSEILMRVAITEGWQEGDRLSIRPGNGISIQGGRFIRYNGQQIGSLNPIAQGFSVRFETTATGQDLQAVLRNVTFEHTTGGPTSEVRHVEFRLGGAARQNVQVTVQPTPDIPIAGEGMLPDLIEDTNTIGGASLRSLDGIFLDPDLDDRFTAAVIVGNPLNNQQGIWYYSTNGGGTWLPVGEVNDTELSLVLSSAARIGFLPAPDFQGLADPLSLRVLDLSYDGGLSSIEMGVRQPLLPMYSEVVSQNVGTLGVHVINLNDPPVANVPSLSLNAVQEVPMNHVLDQEYFEDIDSELVWSLSGANGLQLPPWLSFVPAGRQLIGTPRNRDVGTYQLIVSVTDGQYDASFPLTLNVVNVNDRPESLRFDPLPLHEGVAGVRIGNLFAIDPDNDEVSWTASDPRIIVQGNQVMLASAIDYETEQRVPVTFWATDNGTPPRTSEIQVVLNVIDVNEFYPDLASEDFEVLHGTPGGVLLKQLTAPDGDLLQTVRFTLRGGDVEAFSLNPTTGELRFLPNADLKQKSDYKVFVEASDNGTPRNSKIAQLNVRIVPVNNHPPVVPIGQRLTFEENLPAGTTVGRVEASDADDNPLRFELLEVIGGALNWATIHPLTGVVSVTASHAFDFESGLQHSLRVRVTEEIAPQRSVEVALPIVLRNVNDRPHGLEPVRMWTSRQGAASQPFVVLDQDLSSSGYSFTTSDPRFELRDGTLALRPNRHFDRSLAGTNTTAAVRVTDNSDPTSMAELRVTVQIVLSQPWQNPLNHLDVNRDGRVNSFDALQIINALNSEQERQLNSPRLFDQMSMPDYDTNGDNRLTAVDALLVINSLNLDPQGEGELDDDLPPRSMANPETWMMAYDQLEEVNRRRRR